MKQLVNPIEKKIKDYSDALKKIGNKIAQRDISNTLNLVTSISLKLSDIGD